MQKEMLHKTQWFIVTTLGWKEVAIKDVLIEKMKNYNYYGNEVKEIRVFTTKKVDITTYQKNDPNLPLSLKNTKTIKWETQPNGGYKKIKTTISNKFPNYIFINMVLNPDIWYAIRNTTGVMGFVGSSGKGILPTPINIHEFEDIAKKYETKMQTTINKNDLKNEANEDTSKIEKVNNNLQQFKVGNTVIITSGNFAGTKALITKIDYENNLAEIQFELFGRTNKFSLSFNDLKLDK